MVWIPFADQLAAINSIGAGLNSFLESLFPNLVEIIVSICYLLLYPAVVFVGIIYTNIQAIYEAGIGMINLVFSFPNIVSALFQAWLPAEWPTVWTMLFLISVGFASMKRGLRVLQYIKAWVPFIWGR